MSKTEDRLRDLIASTVHDPLRFVQLAFPWKEPGALRKYEGPDKWQLDYLTTLRDSLKLSSSSLRLATTTGHGVGKGLKTTEPVLTPSGWVTIGELRVGDEVIAVNGSPTRVTGVFPQGVRPLFRVTLDDGCSIVVDDAHLWYTTTRGERKHGKPGQVRTTEEIAASLTFPNGVHRGLNHQIPTVLAVQHPTRELPADPYLLGFYLGDGGSSGCTPRIGGLPEVKQELIEGYADVRRTASSPGREHLGGFNWLKAGKTLRALGLEGLKSWEKFIPPIYMHADIQQRAALLRGLLDSDGTVGKNNAITFDTASVALANGVAELVRSLGGVARRGQRQGTLYGVAKRMSYRVYIALPEDVPPFTHADKAAQYDPTWEHKNKQRTLRRFIQSVEPEEPGESVCILVEHPSHLFVGRDHIVTHNTALVSWLILWFISTRSHPQIVVTARTRDQLIKKTWRELALWHKMAINRHWFTWTATKFYHTAHPETWFAGAIPWSAENSESFAGTHSKYVLLIYDEASSIDDIIWEVTEGAMTTDNAIWAVFGNPTRNTGRFRECFGSFKHRWIRFHVDSRESMMANQEQLRQWIEDYGDDSDFVRVRIKGEFPRAGTSQFIATDLVERAMNNHPPLDPHTIKVLSVDVARFGDDQTVITRRQGNVVFPQRKFRGLDTMQVAAMVAEEMDDWQPDATFIDGTGLGAGVVDRLNSLNRRVLDVQAGSSANDKLKYANKRAEMWGRMLDWLKTDVGLPKDKDLLASLTGLEYGHNAAMAVQLEKKADMKSRGLASPDEADSLALGFAEPVRSRNNLLLPVHFSPRRGPSARKDLDWRVI